MDDETKQCPICHGTNTCAVANQQSIDDCWCQQVAFPPKVMVDEKVLSLGSCVCQRCMLALAVEYDIAIKRVD